MNINDEAVEAAAKAMRLHDNWPQEWPDLARAALEAAAPHLMAAAWREGFVEAFKMERSPSSGTIFNPYLSSGAGE